MIYQTDITPEDIFYFLLFSFFAKLSFKYKVTLKEFFG